jgi:hypothetical protein
VWDLGARLFVGATTASNHEEDGLEAIIMEYAILVYRDESRDAEFDWPQIQADYDAYFKQAAEAGILHNGPRLGSSAATTTVKVRDGERLITDGPFIEAREQLGGIFVLECNDLDEVLDWAARCPGATHGVVEVRPVWTS